MGILYPAQCRGGDGGVGILYPAKCEGSGGGGGGVGILYPAECGVSGGGGGGMGILYPDKCGGSGGGGGGVGISYPAECGGSGGGGGGVGTVFSFLSSFLSLKVESKPPKICKMQEIMIINLIHNLLNRLDSTTINANIILQSNLFKTSLWLSHSTTLQL